MEALKKVGLYAWAVLTFTLGLVAIILFGDMERERQKREQAEADAALARDRAEIDKQKEKADNAEADYRRTVDEYRHDNTSNS